MSVGLVVLRALLADVIASLLSVLIHAGTTFLLTAHAPHEVFVHMVRADAGMLPAAVQLSRAMIR